MGISPKASAVQWHLTAQLTDFDSVEVVDINCSPFRMGRHQGLPLTLPRSVVSFLHAELVIQGDALFVRDLNSTNGTFRNGEQITQLTELHDGDLLQLADVALRVGCRPADKADRAVASYDVPSAEPEPPLSDLDRFLRARTVVPFFQPIVSLKDATMAGCEILARSRVAGLKTPDEMFAAASRLNRQAELSRNLRLIGFEKGNTLWQTPHLFINTHTEELATFGLLESLRQIREVNAELPITLEIREPVAGDTDLIRGLRETLEGLHMTLAYDRFGSGHTRRAELAAVRPHYIKLDRSLVHEIHRAPAAQQALLANLVHMVRDLGIVPVAVGIELELEHVACRELGFELGQGFFYGEPAENIPRKTKLNSGVGPLQPVSF